MNPSGTSFGVSPPQEQLIDTESITNLPSERQNTPLTETPLRRSGRSLREVNFIDDERKQLLQKQTETQETLLLVSKSVDRSLTEIARYARKSYELKKEKIEIMKANEKMRNLENHEKTRRHKENMEVKLKELELKSKKFQF